MNSIGNCFFAIPLAALLSSCTVNADDATEVRHGYVLGMFGLQEINYQIVSGQYLMHGDVAIDPDDIYDSPDDTNHAMYSSARSEEKYLWPNNTVAYTFSEDFEHSAIVEKSIAHLERYTSLQFKQEDATDQILFTRGNGACNSYVGRKGGVQDLNMGSDCGASHVAIHEIGHAVGLWHEQSRTDRDEHVTILWDNIQKGAEHNFDRYVNQGFMGFFGLDGQDIGPYDYDSIMHYTSTVFSKNGKATITKNDGTLISYNLYLSTGDIAGIRSLYGFGDKKTWSADFFSPLYELVEVADVNGDGTDDMVFFDKLSKKTYISYSDGTGFRDRILVNETLCQAEDVCRVADVDGNGMADVVVFGSTYSRVYWGRLLDKDKGIWTIDFDDLQASRVDVDIDNSYDAIRLADVDGDNKKDIIAFDRASGDVWVAKYERGEFAPKELWKTDFCTGSEICDVGDFDGNGRADIVAFTLGAERDVWISLGYGNGFGTTTKWHQSFGSNGSTIYVGDMNGDGKDDIVDFDGSDSSVWYALSTAENKMGVAKKSHDGFCDSNDKCVVGDFNGSGIMDVAAVNDIIYVSY